MIHPCNQNYRGWILQKETKKQERPTCTLVLPLPNGRDGPTTATFKGSPLAPWFGLLPGLNFFPSCIFWASHMHPGAQHPEHCTPAQLNSYGSKGDVEKTELSPSTQLGDGAGEAAAEVYLPWGAAHEGEHPPPCCLLTLCLASGLQTQAQPLPIPCTARKAPRVGLGTTNSSVDKPCSHVHSMDVTQ